MRKCIVLLIMMAVGLCSFGAGVYVERLWVSPGPRKAGAPAAAPAPGPVRGQHASMKLLAEYRETGDPRKREMLEQATGECEILAGRIFRAWRTVTFGRADSEECDAAWGVLSANTALSLEFLRLLFSECPDGDDGDRLLELDMMRSTYLGWCLSIAAVEPDGLAGDILEALSRHEDKEVASEASGLLEYVRQDNRDVRSSDYKQFGRYKDLKWLSQRCLPKWMGRADIVDLLGSPALDDGILLVYHGRRDYPRGNYLWLGLFDSKLLMRDWGQSPDEEYDKRRTELLRVFDSR